MLSYWARSKKNTETLLMASKDGQEISAGKIEYIFLPLERMQESHNIKITNKCFENVAQLR
jgi:hypothetical protein